MFSMICYPLELCEQQSDAPSPYTLPVYLEGDCGPYGIHYGAVSRNVKKLGEANV
jgi:hypothetical protein